MKSLEIPAHRVLEERHELTNEFDVYDQAGEKLCYRGTPYLLFPKKDGKSRVVTNKQTRRTMIQTSSREAPANIWTRTTALSNQDHLRLHPPA